MYTKVRDEKGFTLIELLIVVAIIGILAAIAIPQFAAYRQRAFNGAAVADIKNAKTSQEALFADFQTYGISAGGAGAAGVTLAAAPGGTGAGALVAGAAPASTTTVAGAMITGPRTPDGAAVGVGIGISNAVNFVSSSLAPVAPSVSSASYMMATKHTQGTRVFAAETEGTSIFFVENGTWAGTALTAAGGPATVPAATAGADIVSGTTPGGGAPIATWTAL